MAILTWRIIARRVKSTRNLSEIQTFDTRANDEVERKKVLTEKRKAIIEQDSSPSTSSVSLNNIDFENEKYYYASSQTPSLIKEASSLHEQGEEITISHISFKICLDKHYSNNSVIPKLERPSSNNI